MADAIEADAKERAASLRAMAESIDAGASELLPLDRAASLIGRSVRVLRDAARRGELEIIGPRSARVVRRSELDRWLRESAPKAKPTVTASRCDGDDASFERGRVRLLVGGSQR